MNVEKPRNGERGRGRETEREIKVLVADEKRRSNEAASSNNLASLTAD